jgi:uncharacterized glyoxalase superfamily protein PhnB
MSKNYKPKGYPDLIPFLAVKNMDESINFYQEAFGFKVSGDISKDENGNIIHVEMKKGEAYIMFSPEGAYGGNSKSPITSNIESGVGLYVYCEDVEALYKQAIENGAKSLTAPEDMFWGDRMCRIMDVNNYHWAFGTRLKS